MLVGKISASSLNTEPQDQYAKSFIVEFLLGIGLNYLFMVYVDYEP